MSETDKPTKQELYNNKKLSRREAVRFHKGEDPYKNNTEEKAKREGWNGYGRYGCRGPKQSIKTQD